MEKRGGKILGKNTKNLDKRTCPEGVLNFYMPGNFRTRVHFEKGYMVFESKTLCLVMKSLDGHETGRQATDLDDNFGTPYSF